MQYSIANTPPAKFHARITDVGGDKFLQTSGSELSAGDTCDVKLAIKVSTTGTSRTFTYVVTVHVTVAS